MNILRNIVALVIVLFCIATVAQAAQPEDAGDWIITDGQTLSGSTNISNGSIVIQDGASLDITDATLMMNCTFDGQYNITVENGGTLNITSGSTISAFDDSFYFYIVVKDGADFTMTDSSLSDCGDSTSYYDQGGVPYSDRVDAEELLNAAMNTEPKNADKKGNGGQTGASKESEKGKHGEVDSEMSDDSEDPKKKQFGLKSTDALLSTIDLESKQLSKGAMDKILKNKENKIEITEDDLEEIPDAIIAGFSGIGLIIETDGVTITGNTFSDCDGAIYLKSSNDSTISSNDFTNNSYGIYVEDSNNVTIENNDIEGCGYYGIYLYNSANAILETNTISYSYYENIYIYESDYCDLTDNTVLYSNDVNIYIYSSYYCNLTGNDISYGDSENIYIDSSDYCNLTGNDVSYSNYDNINIEYSDYCNLTGNDISYASYGSSDNIYIDSSDYCNLHDNWIYNGDKGILSYYSENCSITSNHVFEHKFGIRLCSDSDNFTVDSNYVYDNFRGIVLHEADDNLVINNEVYDNKEKGIHLSGHDYYYYYSSYDSYDSYGSDGNNISGNTISDTPYGITLNYCSGNNEINSNTITSCSYGIKVSGFDGDYDGYNEITDNVITKSYFYGLYFSGICDAVIDNNLIDSSGVGIYVKADGDNDNVITNNRITDSNFGFWFDGCFDGQVIDNTIQNSGSYDITRKVRDDGYDYHVSLINTVFDGQPKVQVIPHNSNWYDLDYVNYIDIVHNVTLETPANSWVTIRDNQGNFAKDIYYDDINDMDSGADGIIQVLFSEISYVNDVDGTTKKLDRNNHSIWVNDGVENYAFGEFDVTSGDTINITSLTTDDDNPYAVDVSTEYLAEETWQTHAVNGSEVTLKATLADQGAGVGYATIDATLIGGLFTEPLTYEDGYWVVDITVDAEDNDDGYELPINNIIDKEGNLNNDPGMNFTVKVDDSIQPSITSNGTTSPTTADSTPVQLWITGDNISMAEIDLSEYNGDTTFVPMTLSGSKWVYTLYPDVVGTYNFPVNAYSRNGEQDSDLCSIDLEVVSSDPLSYNSTPTTIVTYDDAQLGDGSVRGEKVQVNPQGTKVVFTYDNGSNEIYVMDIDGTNPIRLTNNSDCDTKPDWSPDGTKIAYTNGSGGQSIWVVEATEGAVSRQVYSSSSGYNSQRWSEWSPDGTKIAFISHNGIGYRTYWTLSVINADGTESSWVDIASVTKFVEHGGSIKKGMNFDWSPDSQWLAFSVKFGDQGQKSDIFKARADGSEIICLTQTPQRDEYGLEWSPDGTKIVYVAKDKYHPSEEGSGMDIWLMNADGSGQTNLMDYICDAVPDGCDAQPTWSPNGEYIVWKSQRDSEDTNQHDGHLWIMKADGTDKMNLTAVDSSYEDIKPSVGYQDIVYYVESNVEPTMLSENGIDFPVDIRVLHFDEAYFKPLDDDGDESDEDDNDNGGGSRVSGGSSGEDSNNVHTPETVTKYLYAGTPATYDFKYQDVIVQIEFDSRERSEYVKCLVEILKGPSTQGNMGVPPGEVFTYANIYLGAAGWNDGNKIDNPEIDFAVPADWFTENGIDPVSITMYRYDGEEWQKLETTMTRDGDGFYYFTAKTPGFSTFAIVGFAEGESAPSEPGEPTATAEIPVADETETDEPEGGIPGFGFITGAVGMLAALWIVTRKYNKE